MERLDELSSGVRGKKIGKDKDCPLVASLAAADHTASTLDALQTSFAVLCQTLVHLGPAVRREQDYSSSKLVSQDLLPGAPLGTAPPSALR